MSLLSQTSLGTSMVTSGTFLLLQNNGLLFNFDISLAGGEYHCKSFETAYFNGESDTFTLEIAYDSLNPANLPSSTFEVLFTSSSSDFSISEYFGPSSSSTMNLGGLLIGSWPVEYQTYLSGCVKYTNTFPKLANEFNNICILNTCGQAPDYCSSSVTYIGQLAIPEYNTPTDMDPVYYNPSCTVISEITINNQYPTSSPTESPTEYPTESPTAFVSAVPTSLPTVFPVSIPSLKPSLSPSCKPTLKPSTRPTNYPTFWYWHHDPCDSISNGNNSTDTVSSPGSTSLKKKENVDSYASNPSNQVQTIPQTALQTSNDKPKQLRGQQAKKLLATTQSSAGTTQINTGTFLLVQNTGMVFNYDISLSGGQYQCKSFANPTYVTQYSTFSLELAFNYVNPDNLATDVLELIFTAGTNPGNFSTAQYFGLSFNNINFGGKLLGVWPAAYQKNLTGCIKFTATYPRITNGFTAICLFNNCGYAPNYCSSTVTYIGQFAMPDYKTTTAVDPNIMSPTCTATSFLVGSDIYPTAPPTKIPTTRPTSYPSTSPTYKPSPNPSSNPSVAPTVSFVPTTLPSMIPTKLPSSLPSVIPTTLPTSSPTISLLPSITPSMFPTVLPTVLPSVPPTNYPSSIPTQTPTVLPTIIPTIIPSSLPSIPPTILPTTLPTSLPSILPTSNPTVRPTLSPSSNPSKQPTFSPTIYPTAYPTIYPTVLPSSLPTTIPSVVPSTVPSKIPTALPSATPSALPTLIPSTGPSALPTMIPTTIPSVLPTPSPTMIPSIMPSVIPSNLPSSAPTVMPSNFPSSSPTILPTTSPSVVPTTIPTVYPTIIPSVQPSFLPTFPPSTVPTTIPSSVPSAVPTESPTALPSQLPSASPSTLPTALPTEQPTNLPTSIPSTYPTTMPSSLPSAIPTESPTALPSQLPSASPSTLPTALPTEQPTTLPTSIPSTYPTTMPSSIPSAIPSTPPTLLPTEFPSSFPSTLPTALPTEQPTALPTSIPSTYPTTMPSSLPSAIPTESPTALPSQLPSASPSTLPTSLPTQEPTILPTIIPTSLPTVIPTTNPSIEPTVEPTDFPTFEPTVYPTTEPTVLPTAISTSTSPIVSFTIPDTLSDKYMICPGDTLWGGYTLSLSETTHSNTIHFLSGEINIPMICPSGENINLKLNLSYASYDFTIAQTTWNPIDKECGREVYQSHTIIPMNFCNGQCVTVRGLQTKPIATYTATIETLRPVYIGSISNSNTNTIRIRSRKLLPKDNSLGMLEQSYAKEDDDNNDMIATNDDDTSYDNYDITVYSKFHYMLTKTNGFTCNTDERIGNDAYSDTQKIAIQWSKTADPTLLPTLYPKSIESSDVSNNRNEHIVNEVYRNLKDTVSKGLRGSDKLLS